MNNCETDYQKKQCQNFSKENSKKKNALLGFRSKKIISIIYLLFVGLCFYVALFEGRKGQISLYDFLIDKIYAIIVLSIFITPYIFLSNTKFREKIPLFKNHKKSNSLLGITLVTFLVLTVSGCVNSMHSEVYKKDMKNHAYVETDVKTESCYENGKITLICQYCNKKEMKVTERLEHEMNEIYNKQPSEFEEGKIIKKCINCDFQEEIILDKILKGNNEETQEELNKNEKEDESMAQDNTEVNNKYLELTDEEFILLTEMIVKSFYSLTLEESYYQMLEENTKMMEVLNEVLIYGYNNYFELPSDYKNTFAKRYDIIEKTKYIDELNKKFFVGKQCNMETGEWETSIKSYALNKDDVVEYGNKKYIDAEGYLDKGVKVHWIEDGEMVEVGKIIDISYNKKIEDTFYPYAIYVEFYDDPFSSGWNDGEIFLTANKKYSGRPLYYVDITDINRKIIKEEMDYKGIYKWTLLKNENNIENKDVYVGLGGAKSYVFRVMSVNKPNDIMVVKYPSGSIEYKSYNAIMNNTSLYTKQNNN